MGAAITTSNPADFGSRQQTYFSKQLLKALIYNLRLAAYGVAKEVPANSGADTIRFFRPRKAATTYVAKITEGTTPTNLTEVSIGYVDCQLKQRGALAKITDIVRAIDLFDTLQVYVKTMGADAALDFDSICRNAICANPAVAAHGLNAAATTMYNSNGSYERFAGVVNTANSGNDFATFHAQAASAAKLTRAVHLGAITQLRQANVPMVNGKYPVIVPAQVLFDVRQDSTWIAAAIQNAEALKLFKWAEFELDGGVFVEAQNAYREGATYGTYSATGENFGCLYLGAEAFGVPKLSGDKAGSDPRSPSMIILTAADKADPLNQVVTAGWKSMYMACLLLTNEASDVPHVVVQRVKSTFA